MNVSSSPSFVQVRVALATTLIARAVVTGGSNPERERCAVAHAAEGCVRALDAGEEQAVREAAAALQRGTAFRTRAA